MMDKQNPAFETGDNVEYSYNGRTEEGTIVSISTTDSDSEPEMTIEVPRVNSEPLNNIVADPVADRDREPEQSIVKVTVPASTVQHVPEAAAL